MEQKKINELLGQDSSFMLMLSHFSHVRAFATLWTLTHQASLSMEFSRQEYTSGLPFPSPGDLLTQGSNIGLLHCSKFITICATREALHLDKTINQKDMHTPVFIVALVTIAKTGKQPQCPSTEEWIKKMWYIFTTEYCCC